MSHPQHPAASPTLLRARWLISAPDAEVLTDAALLVRGRTVEQIGDWATLRAEHPQAAVLGSERHALIPGLVNAHHHSSGVTSLQHGVPDRLLEPWIASFAGMRAGERRLETLLSAAALLTTGVTSVVDVVSSPGDAARFERAAASALAAYDASGMRAAVAPGSSTRSLLVHGEDEAFAASLPDAVRDHAARLARGRGGELLDDADYFAVMEALHGRYADHRRVALWFGPPGPQWVSDALLQRASEMARAWGVGVQTHVNESFYEKLYGERAYGKPTVAHLAELGVLGPHFSLAHGVWLTESEIETLAATGAALSHNPSSNLRLRAGIAPLNRLLEAGVTTAIGMDGTTLGDEADMFTEMRLALRLHRTPALGTPAPSVADVLGLATTGGARLLAAGADDAPRLGRIAPGCPADLVLVDMSRPTWPWTAPECDPRSLVVTRARAGDVDTVLVDGEVVVRDGKPVHIDVAALGAELAEHLRAASVDADARAAFEAVLPYLERWYLGWETPGLEPWTVYGSRR